MIQGHDIICISTSDWDYPIGSKQQVMRRLAKANRVLYVEYQASWLHPLRYLSLRDRWKRPERLRRVTQNMWVYTPRPALPYGPYLRTINALNQSRMEGEVREVTRALGFARPILWLYTPLSQPLVGRLDESLVVYHCIADFPAEKAFPLRQQTLGRLERDLVHQADVVFAISTSLMKKFSPWARNLQHVPSGVDWERFSDLGNIHVPREMERVARPRIGIVGIINYTADLDVLEALAARRPEWTFVHVGTVELARSKAQRLRALPNWVSFGRRPYEEVPGFTAGMDVCLLPLTDTSFTRGVSSLRLMEYFAMGRPVVATDLPDIRALGEAVYCARGVEEFLGAVERALDDGDPLGRQLRREIAKANSWDSKVASMSELIQKVSKGSRPSRPSG